MSEVVPGFLEKKPKPVVVLRKYHGQPIPLWKGQVAVSAVKGWVKNPRIELEIQRLKAETGEREITQEEIYQIMKDDRSMQLRELAENIRINGLREPLALSFDGRLIDGNRRFFAIKFLLDGIRDSAFRAQWEAVDALVLREDATEAEEMNILVEENFSPSLKKEWPDYVKARHIRQAREQEKLSVEDIARKFNWGKRKVTETLRVLEVIDDFVTFATGAANPEEPGGGGLGLSEREAVDFAAAHYQFFNEAQKGTALRKQLLEGLDPDFQTSFYRWLHQGLYASFPEIRVAYEAWEDKEARGKMEKGGKGAGKAAKAVIDYKKQRDRDDTDVDHRVDDMVHFLRGLKAEQMLRMPQRVLDKLREALEVVIEMTKSGKK